MISTQMQLLSAQALLILVMEQSLTALTQVHHLIIRQQLAIAVMMGLLCLEVTDQENV